MFAKCIPDKQPATSTDKELTKLDHEKTTTQFKQEQNIWTPVPPKTGANIGCMEPWSGLGASFERWHFACEKVANHELVTPRVKIGFLLSKPRLHWTSSSPPFLPGPRRLPHTSQSSDRAPFVLSCLQYHIELPTVQPPWRRDCFSLVQEVSVVLVPWGRALNTAGVEGLPWGHCRPPRCCPAL